MFGNSKIVLRRRIPAYRQAGFFKGKIDNCPPEADPPLKEKFIHNS
jgi:hypothetical protein